MAPDRRDGPPSVAPPSIRPQGSETSEELDEQLRLESAERLRKISVVVALAYLPVAASHALLLPPAGRLPMIGLALACSLILGLAALQLRADHRRGELRERLWVTWLLHGCIVVHSLARLEFAREPSDTMFVGVLAMAIALLPGSIAMHVGVLALYLVGWATIMISYEGYATFSPYLAPLVLTALVSVLVRYLEVSRRRRLLELRVLEQRRSEALRKSEAQRRHAIAHLRHEVKHDRLTGMPNRSSFSEQLGEAFEQARQGKGSLAVLHVDVDRFKVVNDSLGHDVGDRLLQMVSERLLRFVRPGDAVARFGGDEFGVLLSGLRARSDALVVAERLHTVFEEPFVLNDYDVQLSASIGIAMHRPDYTDVGQMLRDADIAMSEAKESRERLRVFDGDMHDRAVGRLQTEVELRRAIREGELEAHYQPLVRMEDGHILGYEALVRWRHPERGLLTPAQFLALAEETGLIIELGRQVMAQACRDLARWRAERDGEPTFVSVNVSPRHFAQPDFEEQVRQALAKAQLPPEQLWVEITEGAVIDQPALAEERIARLRELGVNVVVDDFGVGYSSLGYLQRFDFNVMKLDRSFVEPNHKNVHLLDAMVRVARGLGMTLVAEGLEEREQVHHLRALGVEVGQGYFFARPQPGGEAIALMDQRSPLAELDA